MSHSLRKTITAFVGFQIVWLACAWGVPREIWALPILSGLVYLTWIIRTTTPRRPLILLILQGICLGLLVDTVLINFNLLQFKGMYPAPLEWLSPFWMTILWAAFAASFPYSFMWLQKKYFLAFVLGGLFGPIAYYSGEKFGAIEPISIIGIISLGVLWGISMFIMVKLSEQIRTN